MLPLASPLADGSPPPALSMVEPLRTDGSSLSSPAVALGKLLTTVLFTRGATRLPSCMNPLTAALSVCPSVTSALEPGTSV